VWFGLGMLGFLCLLWSPFSWALYHLQPQSSGGGLGRYVNMRWFRLYLWTLYIISRRPQTGPTSVEACLSVRRTGGNLKNPAYKGKAGFGVFDEP